MVKDVRNFSRLQKDDKQMSKLQIDDITMKDIRKCFRPKKENESIKDRVIRDI